MVFLREEDRGVSSGWERIPTAGCDRRSEVYSQSSCQERQEGAILSALGRYRDDTDEEIVPVRRVVERPSPGIVRIRVEK